VLQEKARKSQEAFYRRGKRRQISITETDRTVSSGGVREASFSSVLTRTLRPNETAVVVIEGRNEGPLGDKDCRKKVNRNSTRHSNPLLAQEKRKKKKAVMVRFRDGK